MRNTTALAGLIAAAALLGCEAKNVPDATQIAALAKKTKAQLVFVKGGEFQMGDFGEIHSSEELPYSYQQDDGPLHKVTVSDFSMAKYKVTLGDYDVYAAANGLPLPYKGPDASVLDVRVRAHPKMATFPAGVDWQDAQGYCRWIGQQIGQAMDLPTEAEWEYAARAGGKFLIFATSNGEEEPGKNFATYEQTEKINGRGYGDLPVGLYPANSLGLYELGTNGSEWASDWYAEDYYEHSPTKDPRGPDSGAEKVVRGMHNGVTHPPMTFQRRSREQALVNSPTNVTNMGYGFRCVSRSPVKQ
jgi:sulfatase modifying factor 1